MASILNTLDLIPGLGNPFGLPSVGLWNLQKGSFSTPDKGATTFYVESSIGQFPNQFTAIDQISDSGGRRLAIYEYPYIDGQGLADLGRKGERFTMNIKFFGPNYQILFKDFIETVTKSKQKGTLNHPVRGSFPARFFEWEFVHRHDEWNAVTIKAVFLEDDTDQISNLNIFDSINSLLRNTLQTLSSVTTAITNALNAAVALKSLPAAILNTLADSLRNITATISSLIGKLGATYSTDAALQNLLAAGQALGNVLGINGGTTTSSTGNPSGQLPPPFQVGFGSADQNNINAQLNAFVNANQITPQQALFSANQARSDISSAIDQITANLGNDGYSIVLQYRILAVQIQTVTQAAITSIQKQLKIYTVPFPMSLRMIAFKNGLSPDRQNDIENLNPFLPSINWIPAGTVVKVPAQ